MFAGDNGYGTVLVVWEGVRELMQNCKDGPEPSIVHKNETLILSNRGVQLTKENLLIGSTTKADDDTKIGQFGEGMKLGLLALARQGIIATIETGTDLWKPELRHSKQFDTEVLCISITKRRNTNTELVVQIPLPIETWEELSPKFLRAASAEKSCMLEGSEGNLYVKGIWICHNDKLKYGYNFTALNTNRDRDMVSDWDLQYATAKLLVDSLNQQHLFAELAEAPYDIKYARFFIDDQKAKALAGLFLEEHGDNARPVSCAAEVEKLGHLNKLGIIVSDPLGEALAKYFGDFDTMYQNDMKEIITEVPTSELSHEELIVLREMEQAVTFSTEYKIVEFGQSDTLGMFKGGEILLSRQILKAFTTAVSVFIHEYAHKYGGDMSVAHGHAVEELGALAIEKWFRKNAH